MLSDCCLSVTLSANLVYYSQTVGWIRMPLSTEVGLRPGDTVLDGDPAPPKKGHFSSHVYCGQMDGWIKNQDDTWYRGRPRPGDIVLDRDPAPTFRGGPQFWGHEYISATVWPIATKYGTVMDIDPLDPSAP